MYVAMSLKKILFLSLLLLCTASLWAVPAKRNIHIVEQPDGARLTISMRGDEHHHYLVTTDGVPIVRQGEAYYYATLGEEGFASSGRLAHDADDRTLEERAFIASMSDSQQMLGLSRQRAVSRRNIATRSSAEVTPRGEARIPVLLVQYADVKFSSSSPEATFNERVNGENYTAEGGCGSIREYFVEQSGGLFKPQFDIIGPVTLDHKMAYYGENDEFGYDLRPREMVEEACKKAFSDQGTNFALYDNNSDGYVDIVYVIYAGYGEASHPDMLDDTIWPHQYHLGEPLSLCGVKISLYACNNELDGYRGTELDGIGTFCHEFSHCLGLPDFYDTSESKSAAFGMKNWSVMDYGCYNNNGHTPCGYNAYEKDCLGWISLVELNSPAYVTLKPLCEGGEAYKIVNDANPDEYYVVEYRDTVRWNHFLPACGMLVLHIDYLASAWEGNVINNDPNHQRVSVIPADGLSTSGTLASDVYPGVGMWKNTSLTSTSSPAAKVYTGEYMNKDITDITSKDGAVTFAFRYPGNQDVFTQSGAAYRIVDAEQRCVVLTEALGGNVQAYRGHYLFDDSVRYEGTDYRIVGIDKGAFRNAKNLRSVTVTNRLMEHVGDSLFHGCTALNAVVWNSPHALPDKAFDADSYRNLLVYLPDTAEVPSSLAENPHTAVIQGGYCDELVLDATSDFYCPHTFTAGEVTYRRTFNQPTGLGASSGWETLVLPFDVQRITHATKGDITPFGVEGDNHCWLAVAQGGSFVATTMIRANTPYIISMPNNDAYGNYSLGGSVAFSSTDALIHPMPNAASRRVAQDEVTTVAFSLCPTYERVEASDKVYALNVGAKYGNYASGSVFAPGLYATQPFSVYMVQADAEKPAPFCRIAVRSDAEPDDAEESHTELSITSRRGGILTIFSPVERTVCLYNAIGHLLCPVVCKAGITEVGPLDEGVYIIDRTKVYVQR